MTGRASSSSSSRSAATSAGTDTSVPHRNRTERPQIWPCNTVLLASCGRLFQPQAGRRAAKASRKWPSNTVLLGALLTRRLVEGGRDARIHRIGRRVTSNDDADELHEPACGRARVRDLL